MKIDRVDLHVVRMPLVRTFVTSTSTRNHLDHILVVVHAGDLAGWGECAVPPNPYYCEETTETCWHILSFQGRCQQLEEAAGICIGS